MRSLASNSLAAITALIGLAQGAACQQVSASQPVTIETLLREMIDRDRLAEFPSPAYECRQCSSYNRESVSPDLPGWFADSDGVYCIRTEVNNGQQEWVLMDEQGPGALTKIWAVCFYYGLQNTTGANINIYLDGNDEPAIRENFFKLVKGQSFVSPPLAEETTRAGNLYFPIPFAKSCKVTMDQKVFYNIINYRKYAAGTDVRTFTSQNFDRAKMIREKVANELRSPSNGEGNVISESGLLTKGQVIRVRLPSQHRAIRQLEIRLDETEDLAQALRSIVLKATFDGTQTVWVPVGDFFNNVGKIRPYDMWERSVAQDGTMICRWVMPYESSAEVSLENLSNTAARASLKVTTGPRAWTKNSMHFFASWRMDEPQPTFPLYDWNFISCSGRGVVVGDQWTVLNPREGWWGEGDEKIYVDDDFVANFPSHFGTGTEDYYGWAGGVVPTPKDEFSHPFLGNIIVGHPRSQGYNVCTRTRVLDAIPFQQRIKFDFEASCGRRSSWSYLQYAQTTFWYGAPGVTYNRKPLREMAARMLPTVADLQAIEERAKRSQYVADGAIEGEVLGFHATSDGVSTDLGKIEIWGDVSGGKSANARFSEKGQFAEFKMTEQFDDVRIRAALAIGPQASAFNVYVNGELVQDNVNLNSQHAGITTPLLDLGAHHPAENAFVVRFEFLGQHPGEKLLSLDYFKLGSL